MDMSEPEMMGGTDQDLEEKKIEQMEADDEEGEEEDN